MSLLPWFIPFIFQAVILFRAAMDRRLLRRYSWFYMYIASSFFLDALMFAFAPPGSDKNAEFYWMAELITDIATCACLAQLSKRIFGEGAGTSRFARVLSALCWIAAGLFAVAYGLHNIVAPQLPMQNVGLARDMLATQAGILISIIWGVLYFGRPTGKNLKGLLLGWGTVMISGVVYFTWASISWTHESTLNLIIYVGNYGGLVIWLVSLWNYEPDPILDRELVRAEVLRDFTDRALRIREFVLAFFARPLKLRNPS